MFLFITVRVQCFDLICEARAVGNIGIGDDLIHMDAVWLFCSIHSLNDTNLTGDTAHAGALSADHVAVLLHALGTLAGSGLGQNIDDLASNDDALSNLSHADEVVSSADSKSNRGWDIARVLVHAFEQLWEGGVHCPGGAGDAHARDDVDEGISNLAEDAHTVLGGGWSDEWNVGEPRFGVSINPPKAEADLPVAGAKVPEAQCFLRRQINHNEAIGSRLLGVLQHALLAVAQERVVVAHQQDWGLEAALPCIADHLEASIGCDAVLKGLLYPSRVRSVR